MSNAADVFPKNHPERADLIDGSIGEGSPFHATFDYYAQGVGETTASLPPGWKDRLVVVRGPGTRGATGLCLEVHDLLLAKYLAGRDKDLAFTSAALRHRLADPAVLLERLETMEIDASQRAVARARIERDAR